MTKKSIELKATVLTSLLLLSACNGEAPGADATPKKQQAQQGTSSNTPPVSPPGATVSGDSIPGQLIVKFRSTGPASVTECAAKWLNRGQSFATATSDGSDSLDKIVRRHGLRGGPALLAGRAGLTTASALVKFQGSGRPGPKKSKGLSRLAGKQRSDLVNVYRLSLSTAADVEAVARELASDPHVEYAHPNYRVEATYAPSDPFFGTSGSWGQTELDLWGLFQMGAPAAWDMGRGAGVVVAVVDTGLDPDHPDISENVWTNPGEIPGNGIDDEGNGFVDDVHGWNFAAQNANPADGNGHGTHVSGTIAAQDNNDVGIVGIAPDAQVMPVKGLDDGGAGNLFDLAAGIVYAAENGADVINNSWGCTLGCPSVPVVEDAVSLAHTAGSVVVFAAGNTASDVRDFAPNNRPETMVVSASQPDSELANFSNFGFLDVSAPGAGNPNDAGVDEPERGILSLLSGLVQNPPAQLVVGTHYMRQAGTSMAAPHVAGLAALIRGLNPTYSPEQVRQVIRRSSADVGPAGFDTSFGYGLAQAAGAVHEPTPLEARLSLPNVIDSSGSLDVTGWVGGADLASYAIHYGIGQNPASWAAIGTGTTSVSPGVMASWNVTDVPEGDVTVRLVALTTDGRGYEDRRLVKLDRLSVTSPAPLAYLGEGQIEIEGSVTAPFQTFDVRVESLIEGTPLVEADIVLTDGGIAPIEHSTLAVWDPTGVPAGHYRILVEATDQYGGVSQKTVPVVVDPLLREGFPKAVSLGFPSAGNTILADVDGDGLDDHIVAHGFEVHVFRYDGTQPAGWPRTVSPAPILDAPAVGDVDGDGASEVVVSSLDGSIWVFAADGSTLPGYPLQMGDGAIGLADLDHDGADEIVRAGFSGRLDVLRGDGSSMPGFPVFTPGGASGGAALADLDGDGDLEITLGLSTGGPYVLVAYSHQGTLLAGFPVEVAPSSNTHQYPTVGDLDRDGDLEIVVTNGSLASPTAGVIAAYHHNGQPVTGWPVELDAITASPPVLADLDGDGSLEVFAGMATEAGVGAMHVFTATGVPVVGWPVHTPDSLTYTSSPLGPPLVVDFDGDGLSEVLLVRSHGNYSDLAGSLAGKFLVGYEHNGVPIAELGRPTYGFMRANGNDSTPSVGDMDGDGLLELVWVEDRTSWRGEVLVHAWNLTTPVTADAWWTTLRGDARHSQTARDVEVVDPIVTLTVSGQPLQVDGDSLYRVKTSYGGIIQFNHPWLANVMYSINGGALKKTPANWGGPVHLAPHTEYIVRVVTPGPMTIQLDWW